MNKVLVELRQSAEIVEWSKAEALDLIAEFSGWWGRHKFSLRYCTPTSLDSPANVMKCTIQKTVRALSEVFLHLPKDDEDEGVEQLRNLLVELAEYNIPAKGLEAAILSKETRSRRKLFKKVMEALPHSDSDIVHDALLAANILAWKLAKEDSRDEFGPIAAMLVQGIQWRHRPALISKLVTVADLVKKQRWFLLLVDIGDLLAGLEQIVEETSSGVKGNDEDGVITIRAEAASLAFALFEYYQDSELGEPKAIQRWQEVCSNPNEFSEVKNSWPSIGD